MSYLQLFFLNFLIDLVLTLVAAGLLVFQYFTLGEALEAEWLLQQLERVVLRVLATCLLVPDLQVAFRML